MFLSSFSFADLDNTTGVTTEEKSWYLVSLSGTTDNSVLHYVPMSEKSRKIQPNNIIFGEIGRLSSIMYLSQSWTVFPLIASGSTATGIILEDMEGIVSLYDLFSTYTITSAGREFRLEQITNGSFYIGKEADGKIAIYAIDGVIRLVFLDKWTEMTNMILFPGSFIRFDPKRNAALKWADLFRTILSLQDWEDEVFEFINPRVNTGNEKDTFVNYRLPLETKILFRVLSARFHNQVEWVDLLKSYSSDDTTPTTQASEWMLNPAKRNHLMLLELKSLLSHIVTLKGTSKSNVDRIAEIYRDAKSLKMESSTAKKTIEQFLLDGRFALYGNISEVGKGYQENYEKIAQMIGITPSSGKSRLLQNLADIYSGNLFLQTSKNSTFIIDTFRPTATTLLSTVQTGWIDQKDYFDIALYAYNILDKVQDNGVLSRDYIENNATYDYLTTFFYAGNKYMNSIDDPDKRNKTISSFSSQFYEKMLSMIVGSLYHTFMKEDHGALFLWSAYADTKSVKINIDTLRYIYKLNWIISNVNDTIRSAYEGWADMDVYTKIQKETSRLNGLASLLDPEKRNENYKKYIESPYVAEIENGIALPKMKDDLSGLAFYVKPVEAVPVSISGSLADKKFDTAHALFPDANISSFIPEWSALRVNRATWYILKTDGTNADGIWSLVINSDELISQMMLLYMGRTIEVKFPIPDISLDVLRSFIAGDLKAYLDIIDSNSDITGGIRIFVNLKRIDIGDQTFILPNR